MDWIKISDYGICYAYAKTDLENNNTYYEQVNLSKNAFLFLCFMIFLIVPRTVSDSKLINIFDWINKLMNI